MSGKEDAEQSSRRHKDPYTPHNPIPTVQHYREVKQHRQEEASAGAHDAPSANNNTTDNQQADSTTNHKEDDRDDGGGGDDDASSPSSPGRAHRALNKVVPDKLLPSRLQEAPSSSKNNNNASQPYQSENKNVPSDAEDAPPDRAGDEKQEKQEQQVTEDTSEALSGSSDPRQRRKDLKKSKDTDGAEREVTDPVTHLPVTIHDLTSGDLKAAPENEAPAGSEHRTRTGVDGKEKSGEDFEEEAREGQRSTGGMQRLFPPPEWEGAKEALGRVYTRVFALGVGGTLGVMMLLQGLLHLFSSGSGSSSSSGGGGSSMLSGDESCSSSTRSGSWTPRIIALPSLAVLVFGGVLGAGVIWALREWTLKKVEDVWESEVWEGERKQGKKSLKQKTPESTQWLNELFASVWPLVNPDLFTSLADTLEDVMQASLPKFVRMVSVDDIGQGSEALRILGVQWLPTGAAAKSVTGDGKLKSDGSNDGKQSGGSTSDRSVPGQGSVQASTNEGHRGAEDEDEEEKEKRKDDTQEDENIAEGMEAEEGDFVNVEVAFAYRARADGRGLRHRSKNAHLYLAFYLPSGIKFPVWVELQGLVGIMRLRLQLCPDPPFFSLCTLSFMGQPKVDLSCVPLTKKGFNIMDLPLISNFVQSAVDAAMAEYVAPKSLTLDLKDMLVGDDFKKDTSARGVLVVRIKRAFDFKEGDAGLMGVKKGTSDPYVTAGWAKFGKPVWSTRVIREEMEPCWDETAYVLVGPDELNVDERLRVQLWDSDRTTADDDLGRIEVDVKQLMRDDRSNGRMWDREDGFKALKKGEGMPGRLAWSVGYFSKTRILDEQLAQHAKKEGVDSVGDLKKKVERESESKLREAAKDENMEIEQQKQQDFKARQDELLAVSRPPDDYPSGILSIQIHQITGLELESLNKDKDDKSNSSSEEVEEGDDMPSAYCTVILNHTAIFRTRTKPKNAKPFFNAGCERFVRDWRAADVHVAVRDARVHEDDPLLGILHLPLGEILRERSQVNGVYPLSGGVGFGRVRVSLLFRAVRLQAPAEALGWEFGTLEIRPEASADVPEGLRGCRLKFHAGLGRAHMHSDGGDGGAGGGGGGQVWKTKKDQPLRLAVRKRYCTPLVIEFRSASKLLDKTPGFAILWLKDVPDEEEQTVRLPVWKGDLKRAEKSVLQECGEKIGEIEIGLIFWRGLGSYHYRLAGKDKNLGGIMEVLETSEEAMGEKQDDDKGEGADGEQGGGGSSSSSSSESSDDEEGDGDDKELAQNGERGMVGQVKDYKKHAKQLHRKNRGLMQWKAPRTVQWVKHKVEHAEDSVTGLFKHGERDTGIETEV